MANQLQLQPHTLCDYCERHATRAHPSGVPFLVYYTCDACRVLHSEDAKTRDAAHAIVMVAREEENTAREWARHITTTMARAIHPAARLGDVLASLEVQLDDMPLGARASARPITLGR